MQDQISISVIVPVYNGGSYVKKCIDGLLKQDFSQIFEIIMVDDASTDDSLQLIKNYNLSNLKLLSLPFNSGPSVARNLGLKNAVGEYVFFLDVDDTIELNTLKTLYSLAIKTNCDYVCSDFKRIEDSANQRDNTFNYPSDMTFNHEDIIKAMHRELYDPSLGHLGLFGCNGRLMRRSLLVKNEIFFDEKIWWTEDRAFSWEVLGSVKSARYIRKQLYSYYVHPNVKTLIIEGLQRRSALETVKLIQGHIRNGLKKKEVEDQEIKKLTEQALIFYTIQVLVSISRSIFLKKIESSIGKKIRKNIINEIIKDNDVKVAVRHYSPSKKESKWIPKAISMRSSIFLEIACNLRARQVVKKRRTGIE
tara:strand:+ start:109 stop:1197 length:1089 start_codon:yes stop_codon:yes gene_type:complete